MSGDAHVCREIVSVRVPCGTQRCAFRSRRRRLARLDDLLIEAGGLAWPILTTAASIFPRRLSRLIRTEDSPHVEADPPG